MVKYVDGYVCALGIQSLCFPSSLTISDWASWVQAVGSIAAILSAAGIVLWQHRLALARDRNVALGTHSEAVRTIREALDQASALVVRAERHAKEKTFIAANDAGLFFAFTEIEQHLDSVIKHDISDPTVRIRVKDAWYAISKARNDLTRDFSQLERGETLEPGLDPYGQSKDVLSKIQVARDSLDVFDEKKRAILIGSSEP